MVKYVSVVCLAFVLLNQHSLAKTLLTASPKRCIIPVNQASCSTTLNYAFPSKESGCLWLRKEGQTPIKAQCGRKNTYTFTNVTHAGVTFELLEGETLLGRSIETVTVIGEKTPAFMQEPVLGVSLFYLDGRDQEDLPQITEKLSLVDSACLGTHKNIETKLLTTLDELKAANINWIRLLVGKGFFEIYQNRCGFKMDDVYPKMQKSHVDKLNKLLSYLTSTRYDFNIELVLGGSKDFKDIANDKIFFESILNGINLKNIELVMLGGDVQPTRVERHATWIKQIFEYFHQHPDPRLQQLNYSFDTVTYHNPDDLEKYVRWVSTNIIGIPVISINLYVNREIEGVGSDGQKYAATIKQMLKAYDKAEAYQPLWIDEYGFRLSNPEEALQYTDRDQTTYYRAFLQSTRCNSNYPKERFLPSFAWAVGNDKYLADPTKDQDRTPFGLFSGYKENNRPITNTAWQTIQRFNLGENVCE